MNAWKKLKRVFAPPTEVVTHGDALVQIHEEGGDGALKLTADIMERSHQDVVWALERQLEDERAQHVRTLKELHDEEYRNGDYMEKVRWLMGGPVPEDVLDAVRRILEREGADLIGDRVS